jgi:predicted nucleotidyltransferase
LTGCFFKNHALSVLCRLDRFFICRFWFREFYRLVVFLASRSLGRLPGVEAIYLRRTLAKEEYIPFLSDIDMAVITGSAAEKNGVYEKFLQMHRLLPILEPESPVLSRQEFLSLSDENRFAENRAILYRIFEAKHTWRLVHSSLPFDLLDRMELKKTRGMEILLLSELLYWHGLVISEVTSFHLEAGLRPGCFRDKRRCWQFMKATTEFMNFVLVLSDRAGLSFNRGEIIRQGLGQSLGSGWSGFLEKNRLILRNRFDWKKAGAYLDEAFGFLSEMYRELFRLLSSKLVGNFELIEKVRNMLPVSPLAGPLECHPVDLAGLDGRHFFQPEDLQAVFITPQPIDSKKTKVLVFFLVHSLTDVPRIKIRRFLDVLENHLRLQNISPQEIQGHIVDHTGFLCFSAPLQFGLKTCEVYAEYEKYFPSLYEMILDRTVSRDMIKTAVRAFFRARASGPLPGREKI